MDLRSGATKCRTPFHIEEIGSVSIRTIFSPRGTRARCRRLGCRTSRAWAASPPLGWDRAAHSSAV